MRPVNEARLEKCLEYIKQQQREAGRTPSYRMIQKACNYSTISLVSYDVARLKECGLVTEDENASWRKITIPQNLETGESHNAQILGTVRRGQPTPAIEDIEETVALPNAIFGSAEHLILHAKGPSMIKRGIFDGDLLVIKKKETAEIGQTVVALLNGDEATCKILAKTSNGRLYLKAANDSVDEAGKRIYDVFPKGEWSIIGVVDFVIHSPNKTVL